MGSKGRETRRTRTNELTTNVLIFHLNLIFIPAGDEGALNRPGANCHWDCLEWGSACHLIAPECPAMTLRATNMGNDASYTREITRFSVWRNGWCYPIPFTREYFESRAVQMTAIYCERYSLVWRNITAPCNLSTLRENKIRKPGKCKPDLFRSQYRGS